jgi:hypothetical protein
MDNRCGKMITLHLTQRGVSRKSSLRLRSGQALLTGEVQTWYPAKIAGRAGCPALMRFPFGDHSGLGDPVRFAPGTSVVAVESAPKGYNSSRSPAGHPT